LAALPSSLILTSERFSSSGYEDITGGLSAATGLQKSRAGVTSAWKCPESDSWHICHPFDLLTFSLTLSPITAGRGYGISVSGLESNVADSLASVIDSWFSLACIIPVVTADGTLYIPMPGSP
jgi:hypothetical protein